jgi:hypothetical protein
MSTKFANCNLDEFDIFFDSLPPTDKFFIINDIDYHNYYFTFGNEKITPYFDLPTVCLDIKINL